MAMEISNLPKVSIVIVNYNTYALTRACLQSVFNFTSIEFEVIVVDNASPDRSIEQLTTAFPTVKLLLNSSNLGFGVANNIGIAEAKGKYIFLLNSDTLLMSDAVQTFYDFMELPTNPHIAGCGGSLIDLKGDKQVSYGHFPSLTAIFAAFGPMKFYANYYEGKLSPAVKVNFDTPKAVDYISGAALFLRKSVLDKVGVFDEAFFLYFEETELAFRIRKSGFALYILPQVQVIHLERSSSYPGGAAAKDKIFAASRLLFFSKCYGKTSALLVKAIYALQQIIQPLKRRKV